MAAAQLSSGGTSRHPSEKSLKKEAEKITLMRKSHRKGTAKENPGRGERRQISSKRRWSISDRVRRLLPPDYGRLVTEVRKKNKTSRKR